MNKYEEYAKMMDKKVVLKNLMGNKTEDVIRICTEMYGLTMNFGWWKNKNAIEELNIELHRTAKYKHVNIQWCGKGGVCMPDQWIISKNGWRYVVSIDSIRYDNVNATCQFLGWSIC